ncbi:MAG TPA: hypothetical protein VE422_43310 [Terriglobia bacterium]|nr:hypothetical protein [Terriglobia bacterium]
MEKSFTDKQGQYLAFIYYYTKINGRAPAEADMNDSKSTIEYYPSGSVVARVLLTANPSVYTPVHESIAHCGRKKEMIQPHPLV